jgi:hypothetical protein
MDTGQELEGGGLHGACCTTAGCERPHKAKGLCSACYKRKLRADGRTGTQSGNGHWGKWKGATCATDGCTAPVSAKGLCKTCYNAAVWRSGKHRLTEAQKRASHLKYRYGISTNTYDSMLESQGGVCAICKQPPTSDNSRAGQEPKLYVDHCHDTNKVRGLLCNHCNLAIGYAKTDERLLAAADYVRYHARCDC